MLLELEADIPSTKEIQEVLGNDGTDKVHLQTLVDNMTILLNIIRHWWTIRQY